MKTIDKIINRLFDAVENETSLILSVDEAFELTEHLIAAMHYWTKYEKEKE